MALKKPKRRVPATLGVTVCPACLHKSGHLRPTAQNHHLYLGCRRCNGRMVGERMVVRYLGRLDAASDIEFHAPWTIHHLHKLLDVYEGSCGAVRPARGHYPILGVTYCPGCQEKTATIRRTADNDCLYLSCTGCGGRVVGERMVVTYLERWVDTVEFNPAEAWGERELFGLIGYYR